MSNTITEQDFINRGWNEIARFGRFIVFEDPSGMRPLSRLNTVARTTKRHRNEDLRTLELMAILRRLTELALNDGPRKDALLDQIRDLAGEHPDSVDPV